MTSAEMKQWVMSEWMEPYRELISNTGGNSIESLLNDTKTNGFNNTIRAAMIVSVQDQVRLLGALHKRGLLAAPSETGGKEQELRKALESSLQTLEHYVEMDDGESLARIEADRVRSVLARTARLEKQVRAWDEEES